MSVDNPLKYVSPETLFAGNVDLSTAKESQAQIHKAADTVHQDKIR